jgi:hypothetical protein
MQKVHEWLPKGWLDEIRAGGENMDKMFKVIFFLPLPYLVVLYLFLNE